MKRAVLAIGLLVLAALLLAGCPQRTPDGATTTTKPAGASTTTTEKKISVKLYFVEEKAGTQFLVSEVRSIAEPESMPEAAVEELIKGTKKNNSTSLIPPKTKVLSVRVENKLATVDFSKEVLFANVGAAGEELGIAQIVNTLTGLPDIERVKFLVEGDEEGLVDGREIRDWWGHIGLYEQPFSRAEKLTKGAKTEERTIIVETPRAFSTVKNPLTVKGKAQVFEAQFQVRILDKNGSVLSDVPVMADNFDWGNFEEQIGYKSPKETGYIKILFYFHSAKDGSEVPMAEVTVFMD
ncbi:MAG: GerMN domain-containing protein [Candidatus Aquicultor sp.]|nr:GerMN domain-containing protein [Candidatus Aquicultor sp.]